MYNWGYETGLCLLNQLLVRHLMQQKAPRQRSPLICILHSVLIKKRPDHAYDYNIYRTYRSFVVAPIFDITVFFLVLPAQPLFRLVTCSLLRVIQFCLLLYLLRFKMSWGADKIIGTKCTCKVAPASATLVVAGAEDKEAELGKFIEALFAKGFWNTEAVDLGNPTELSLTRF